MPTTQDQETVYLILLRRILFSTDPEWQIEHDCNCALENDCISAGDYSLLMQILHKEIKP